MKIPPLLLLALSPLITFSWPRTYHRLVRAAEDAYKRGDYLGALQYYQAAAPYSHDPGFIAFNQAAVLVRLRRWQEAINYYTQALEDAQGLRRVLSLYGRGTAKLALALEPVSSDKSYLLQSAIADLRACLQEQPDFDDARYHLHLAEQLLAHLKTEKAPTQDVTRLPNSVTKPLPPNQSQRPPTKPEPSPTGLKPVKPFPELGQDKPIETSDHILPGRGQLPAIPPTADSPPLNPQDARAWIAQEWERITTARAQRPASVPHTNLVKDW